ncbi:MAG: prolyl oligopeptidase family serine peptidase [Planctomycetota bacterium]
MRSGTFGWVFSIALLVGAPSTAAASETGLTPLEAKAGIAKLLNVRAPSAPQFAPDGTAYLRDWPDGVFQLFRRGPDAPIDEPGEQITDLEDGISSFWVSPTGQDVLFTASIGGSEQNDIYRYNAESGEIATLYSDPGVVFTPQVWLSTGEGFIYTANDQDPTSFHVYYHNLQSNDGFPLLQRDGYWFVSDVTDDFSKILLGRYESASASEVHMLDLEAEVDPDKLSGNMLDFSQRHPTSRALYSNLPIGFGPGAVSAYYFSDITGERRIYQFDFRRRSARMLPIGGQGVELAGAALNRERTKLAVLASRDGYSRIFGFRTRRNATVRMPDLGRGVMSMGQFIGDDLVYTLSNPTTPGVSFRVAVGSQEEPERLTSAYNAGVDLSVYRQPELVYYPSFDRGIPAYLYLPEGAAKGDPVPFIVMYHGGPESQARPSFSAVRQGFVDEGFGVLVPNVRGSTGYGTEYHQLDNAEKRWDSVRDGWAAARWLVSEGYAEPGRIAAYGGSYGGFMACAVVIEDTRRVDSGEVERALFGASVNIVGIVNFKTFLEQTGAYRRELREAEYGQLSNEALLAEISPINYTDQINVPMLIAHGANDPRVPVGEAQQMAAALEARGIDNDLLIFDDEGHGFAKLENRLEFYGRAAEFLRATIGVE